MRFITVFQYVALMALAFAAQPALAQNLSKYIWGPPNTNPVRPYLEEAKIPHNSQWADDQWRPQDWIDSRGGSAAAVIDGFYESGIITDQYTDGDIPVLEVGQRFLELSDQDKRRVAAFVDETFGITRQSGLFLINFHKNDTPVGVFTAQGLQLQ
jgi:hypothetical protein